MFQDKLALNITMEQGKTLKDAQGDVFRGLGLQLPFITQVYLTYFTADVDNIVTKRRIIVILGLCIFALFS